MCRGSLLLSTLVLTLLAGPAAGASLEQISSDSGLRASVSSEGAYQLTASNFGWTFRGSLGQRAENISVNTGTDGIGSWLEIAFSYSPARTGVIRVYNGTAVALFTTVYGVAGPNSGGFPHWTSHPQGLNTFGYAKEWDYGFTRLNPHSPWLFFDDQANAFMFSPASNFMTAVSQIADDGAIEAAIDSRITSLPAGFTHTAILAFGPGVNSASETWGRALTGLTGKQRSTNDSITLLDKLSYWTDAGSAYYYHPQDPTQVVPTLLKIPPIFAQAGTPVGSMELDSWHYPKGSPPWWGSNGSGMASFQADPAVFPQGLKAFQQSIGMPLITHARWIDAKSDIRNNYKMSGNVSIDPRYWQEYAAYLRDNGVEVLEQDWLFAFATTDFNLTDPDAFLDNMAGKMAAAGVKVMYCMPLWADIMQSSKYDNVFAIRISPDFMARDRWDTFLLNSRIASAVGLWPFTDAFNSGRVKDVLLAILSAGPVGSGDSVTGVAGGNLQQAVRADGVIVKPDVPITPVDSTWVGIARDRATPVVAATYTDHGGGVRTAYVFAYDRTEGAIGAAAFTPEGVGVTGPAYVYDYFKAKGSVINGGTRFTDNVDFNGSYYIVAPIGKSGMAFLGDAGKFASNGRKRIESLSDDGRLHVIVRFAANEKAVAVHLYSPEKPYAMAGSGGVSRVLREGAGLYRVTVTPDQTGVAAITFGTR